MVWIDVVPVQETLAILAVEDFYAQRLRFVIDAGMGGTWAEMLVHQAKTIALIETRNTEELVRRLKKQRMDKISDVKGV